MDIPAMLPYLPDVPMLIVIRASDEGVQRMLMRVSRRWRSLVLEVYKRDVCKVPRLKLSYFVKSVPGLQWARENG